MCRGLRIAVTLAVVVLSASPALAQVLMSEPVDLLRNPGVQKELN
jgi:hypothetical protein